MLVDDVEARLKAKVPVLDKRVQGVLDLAELLRRKALPQSEVAAFVVDNGMSGAAAEVSDGAFLQAAEEMVSVLLVIQSAGDVNGARAKTKLHQVKWAVIFALAGWGPDPSGADDEDGTDPIGVLELRRGRVNSLDAGTVFYQLDFAIAQQIRVIGND